MGERTELLLRPLSIGEIFDRAVTLSVRNWIPLGLIALICVVPTNFFDYLAAVNNAGWGILGRFAQLLLPVGTMATAAVIAQLYRRETVDWRPAFGSAFSRIMSAIGVNLTFVLIALLPLLIIVGIPAGLGVFKFSNIADDLIALLVIIVAGAIAVGLVFAGAYALNAMEIDDYRAMDSVGRALGLFARDQVARTMVFALAQATLLIGGSFLAGLLLGLIDVWVHNLALGTIVETLLMLVTSALSNVVVSVYYFDVAIRSEGYDLQVALDAMPS